MHKNVTVVCPSFVYDGETFIKNSAKGGVAVVGQGYMVLYYRKAIEVQPLEPYSLTNVEYIFNVVLC
jgi:hypothetical protein